MVNRVPSSVTSRSWRFAWNAAAFTALIVLIALSIGGLWELFPGGAHRHHLLAWLATALCAAIVASVAEYHSNRMRLSEAHVSHERLRMALVSGKSVAWDLDVKTGRDHWFGDLQTMFGIPSENSSVQMGTFYRYVHPDDRESVSQAVADARDKRKPYSAEFRVVHENGTVRWVKASGEFSYSKKGEPVRMLGIAVDITESKQAQEALIKSEEKFSRAFRAGPVTMTLTSARNHRYLDVNDTFEQVTGWKRDEVIGRSPLDINIWVDPGEGEQVTKLVLADKSIRNFEVHYRCKNGSLGVGLASAEFVEIDGEQLILSAIVDITDRSRAENQLRNKDADLAEAQRMAHVGSWDWNIDSGVIHWSEELYRIYGLDPTQPAPAVEDLPKLYTPETWNRTQKAMAENSLPDMDMELIRPDGSKRWIHTSFDATRDARGRITKLRGVSQDITDEKQTRDLLRESEERVKAIITSAMDAIVAVDEECRIVLFNAAAEGMFQCSANEVIGTQVERFIPLPFRSSHREQLEHFAQTEVTNRSMGGETELHALRSNGEPFPIEASIAQAENHGKKLFTVIIRDITERLRAETTLRESEERFRRVVEHIGDGVIVDDIAGRLVFANDRFLQLFGFDRDQAPHLKLEDYIAPEYRAELRDRHDQRVRGESVPSHFEYEGIRVDGSRMWLEVEVVPVTDTEDKIVGTQSAVRDITDRKRAEQALRESEERFRLVANSAPVMIWMAGPDKLCNYFNKPWLDFTGRPLEAELGHGWTDGVHPEDYDACLRNYERAFDERQSFEMEYRLRRHDGEHRWLLDIGVPRFNVDGSFAGYIGSCLDITERKLAEEAMSTIGRRLIEAHEEERAWIGRELHDDINQRLALLAVELDRVTQHPSEEVGAHVRHAQERITQIARDVQSLSHRLHSSKLEYLGLARAANSFCRELSEQSKVEIHFKHADIPHTLPKEVSLCLFRVLQEALQNATKYSGVRDFTAELYGTSESIELTVTDSGKGFEEQEAFTGHGLGLISMRERLQLVHGEFSVKSRPGAGTTIYARVPLNSDEYRSLAG
jgi:PAS domain S-box-containing protein